MFTARSILSFAATSTATQCSAALPTIATTNTPTKNSDSPIVSDASEIEPTSTSLMMPTSTAATPSRISDFLIDQPPCVLLLALVYGLKTSLWVQREQQAQPVADHQHDRHAERELLEVGAEVHVAPADAR